jgi:hypothetical protein
MLRRTIQIVAIACAGTFFHACDRRAPESAFHGTWDFISPHGLDTADWISFKDDHKWIWFTADGNGECINDRGSWYAGGKFLYLRREGDGKKYVWKIIEILPNELQLGVGKDLYVLRRAERSIRLN